MCSELIHTLMKKKTAKYICIRFDQITLINYGGQRRSAKKDDFFDFLANN